MTLQPLIKKEDRYPKPGSNHWWIIIGSIVYGGLAAGCGYFWGQSRWGTLHAHEIQGITEHVINAKAELEAGNRNACSDELVRITEQFQKLY